MVLTARQGRLPSQQEQQPQASATTSNRPAPSRAAQPAVWQPQGWQSPQVSVTPAPQQQWQNMTPVGWRPMTSAEAPMTTWSWMQQPWQAWAAWWQNMTHGVPWVDYPISTPQRQTQPRVAAPSVGTPQTTWPTTVGDDFFTGAPSPQQTTSPPPTFIGAPEDEPWYTWPAIEPPERRQWPPPIESISRDRIQDLTRELWAWEMARQLESVYGRDKVNEYLRTMIPAKTTSPLPPTSRLRDAIDRWTEQMWDREAAISAISAEYRNRWLDWNEAYSALLAEDRGLTSDIDSVNEMMDYYDSRREEYNTIINDVRNDAERVINEMREQNVQFIGEYEQIHQQRVDNLEDTYTQVFDKLGDLERQANDLFDMRVIEATRQRANNLANQGILTSAQASAAAWFILRDYTAQANLARWEMLLQIGQEYTNAIKERWDAMDALAADQNMTVQQKQMMATQLNDMYMRTIEWYQNAAIEANTKIDAAIANAYAKQIELDLASILPVLEQQINTQLTQTERDLANTNPDDRMWYLFAQINSISPTLTPYATEVVRRMLADGSFMGMDLPQLIAQVTSEANSMFRQDNFGTWGGATWGWWGATWWATPPPATWGAAWTWWGTWGVVWWDIGVWDTQQLTPEEIEQLLAEGTAKTSSRVDTLRNINNTITQSPVANALMPQFLFPWFNMAVSNLPS